MIGQFIIFSCRPVYHIWFFWAGKKSVFFSCCVRNAICMDSLIILSFVFFFFLYYLFSGGNLLWFESPLLGCGQLGDIVFSDTPRIRLDSGGRQFRRRWGYDGSAGGGAGGSACGTGPGSLNGGAGHLEDIEEDGDDFSDTYSLRDETLYNSILHEGKSRQITFFPHTRRSGVPSSPPPYSLCSTGDVSCFQWRNSVGNQKKISESTGFPPGRSQKFIALFKKKKQKNNHT